MLLALCGCSEDIDSIYSRKDRAANPVRFTAEWPTDGGMTRAIADKREFEEGDVIHVSAVFTLIESTPGTGNAPTCTKYAALTLENGEWVNKMTVADKEFDMEWPWNAKSAVFTAYYMKDWNGPITNVDVPLEPVVLDRFVYDRYTANPDPLEATSEVVEYGHAVKLQFAHLCTRLTITDVADEDEYELRFNPTPDGERTLRNACTMSRNDANILSFDFVEEESKKISSQVDVDGTGTRSVTFHLEPGDYKTFTLTRRNGRPYLTLSNVEDLVGLEEGNAYTVSLKNLKANITQDDTDGDWWDGEEPTLVDYPGFSVQAFMQAIHDCNKDYNCTMPDGTQITLLKKDPYRNEMLLMVDVDFKNETDYTPVDLPDIATFDGGGKTIMNIARPLFKDLRGTVKELNLWNAKLEDKPGIGQGDNTDWGVLAGSCDGGEVSNVRLINAELDIVLDSEETANRTYNVGALIGKMSSGILTRVILVDKISVKVSAEDSETTSTVCVGGVIGQCTGTLENIDNVAIGLPQPRMSVTNACMGRGTRYTGGLVGLFAGGRMNGCEISTEVSAENAVGTWNYAGGVAGAVRAEGVIANATVSGSVKGGKAIAVGNNPHSSTGGIVGHVQKSSVTGGIAFSKVSISSGYETSGIYYTVGGVIGSMSEAKEIRNNEGWNKFDPTLYNEPYYAGRFSGNGNEQRLGNDNNTADGTGKFVGYNED